MKNTRSDDEPSTVEQIAEAMTALGLYGGKNSSEEHAAEARRLGGMKAYRARLVNALLGGVEVEAMLTDGVGLSEDQMGAAHQQALQTAGVAGQPTKLLSFLRWRTLRAAGPLREIAQNRKAGPLVLAAAHAGDGFQLLLSACAAGQNIENLSPDEVQENLTNARESLTNAIANLDIFLSLLEQVNNLH